MEVNIAKFVPHSKVFHHISQFGEWSYTAQLWKRYPILRRSLHPIGHVLVDCYQKSLWDLNKDDKNKSWTACRRNHKTRSNKALSYFLFSRCNHILRSGWNSLLGPVKWCLMSFGSRWSISSAYLSSGLFPSNGFGIVSTVFILWTEVSRLQLVLIRVRSVVTEGRLYFEWRCFFASMKQWTSMYRGWKAIKTYKNYFVDWSQLENNESEGRATWQMFSRFHFYA